MSLFLIVVSPEKYSIDLILHIIQNQDPNQGPNQGPNQDQNQDQNLKLDQNQYQHKWFTQRRIQIFSWNVIEIYDN